MVWVRCVCRCVGVFVCGCPGEVGKKGMFPAVTFGIMEKEKKISISIYDYYQFECFWRCPDVLFTFSFN